MPSVASWSPLEPSKLAVATGPYVVLHLRVERNRRTWLGRCVELGTMAVGKTEDEARTSLIGLATLQLNTLEQTGQRERVFRERGITLRNAAPAPSPTDDPSADDAKQLFEALTAVA